MIYNLVRLLEDHLEKLGIYGYFRPFTYPEFRAVLAIILSFVFVLIFGRRVIRFLVKLKIGDSPEFYNQDLNQLMKQKANTPTMGGILIGGAIFATTLLLADLGNWYIRVAMLCLIWLSAVGGVDDYLKLTSARRKPGSREGFYSWEKFLFQVGLAVLVGLVVHRWGIAKFTVELSDIGRMSRSLTLPFFKTWVMTDAGWAPSPHLIELGPWAFVILTVLVITGTSNAVNLTDGMDGLASGVSTVVAFALMVLSLIAGWGDGELAKLLLVPYIPQSNELAVIAGAIVGGCLGFLWFNCHPAQVFMGDTGSLALGGLMGYIAVVIRQEFLLLIIGGVFVAEALSVILQVGYFKLSGGKRIFRCAPLHHHFHLAGWTEQQVVVRFWIISAILAALALATIKLR
ncbi:MAG: phospho-N-acetylmuramoyl-pentapeptide-transferase [Phycisphaeraceae bacterium]|nr:phospho-N-acetylmuramoyl-pentapeptide-transferase [Phycisphaeraceae bacterium]